MKWLYVPFLIQGFIMGVDEVLHLRRKLPRWERIGHPLDTLTVVTPYIFVLMTSYTETMAKFYIGLCLFSCLFVTKDEFIHAKSCSPFEQWLHSLLFILHPMTFLCAGMIWKDDPKDNFLIMQASLIVVFFIYQTLRWNFSWEVQQK